MEATRNRRLTHDWLKITDDVIGQPWPECNMVHYRHGEMYRK